MKQENAAETFHTYKYQCNEAKTIKLKMHQITGMRKREKKRTKRYKEIKREKKKKREKERKREKKRGEDRKREKTKRKTRE